MSGLYHIFHGFLDRREQKLAARNTDAQASVPAPVQVEDVRMESVASGGCGVSVHKHSVVLHHSHGGSRILVKANRKTGSAVAAVDGKVLPLMPRERTSWYAALSAAIGFVNMQSVVDKL